MKTQMHESNVLIMKAFAISKAIQLTFYSLLMNQLITKKHSIMVLNNSLNWANQD